MLQMYQMPQSPTIFDRTLLRARQQRARALGPETFLIDRVAAELGERLSVVLRQFERAVDLGTPTDAVRRALAESGKVATIVAAAPAPAPRETIHCASPPTRRPCRSPTARSIWSSPRWRCNL